MERPHIFDYHDYRTFLDDFFQYKRWLREEAGRATYTHEMFALEAGLKSRAALVRIKNGERHLTEALVRAFSRALELAPDEESFLGHLAAREKAQSEVARRTLQAEEARTVAGKQGATRRDQRARDVADKAIEEARSALRVLDDRINGMRRMARATLGQEIDARVFGSWSAMTLLELSRCKDFTWDTERIVRLMGNRVSADEIERHTRMLREARLLVEDERGVLVPSVQTVDCGPEAKAVEVGRYYIGIYERLGEAMRRGFVDRTFGLRCRLQTATFAIPSSAIPRMREEVLKQRDQLFGFFEGLEGEPDVVYQVWLHAFPLTEVVGEDRA